MKILAFTGSRFTDAAGRVDELAAPPFDQIGPELRDRLHAQSEHQYSHLTRPVAATGTDAASGHVRARSLYEQWLAEGAIAADPEPTLYPYVIERAGGRRYGLCCLVDVVEGSGDIRPHELTVDKPLEERLALLETLRVDLEPVMFMADDGGGLEPLLTEDVGETEPLASYYDEERGERHLIYGVTDEARQAAYREVLSGRSAVIADGHHRTKVAQLFAQRHGARSGTAAGAKLAVLFSLADSDLTIDPIHRAVQVPVDAAALEAMAAERRPFSQGNDTGWNGSTLAVAVAAAPQPSIGVRFRGGDAEIWRLDPDRVTEGMPGGDTRLAAVMLHHQLLPAAGLGIETATDGSIAYRSDPEALWGEVEEGKCELAVWLPPMQPSEFAAATAGGDVLPAKSTRFLPKLISGLVWCGHDARVR